MRGRRRVCSKRKAMNEEDAGRDRATEEERRRRRMLYSSKSGGGGEFRQSTSD
jgi:hypothetical protein